MDRVSVIIPAYNSEDTVGEAVVSALREPEVGEVLVVDDGSTDGTPQAVPRGDSRVRYIRQENGGPSRARDLGIREARFPWIAFLDADDAWLPGKLARQFAVVHQHPDTILVAGDWVRQGEPPWGQDQPLPGPLVAVSLQDLLTLNRFQTSTVLVRTEAIRSLGGFDPSLDGVEDWDMWTRLAGLGPVWRIALPLVVYRDVESGYSKDLWRVYRTMEDMFGKYGREGGAPFRLPPVERRRLLGWHHLRFALGFYLAGDRQGAARALKASVRPSLLPGTAVAFFTRFLPFLAQRLRRRRRTWEKALDGGAAH